MESIPDSPDGRDLPSPDGGAAQDSGDAGGTRHLMCVPLRKYDASGKAVTDRHGRAVYEEEPLRYVVAGKFIA